MTVQDGDYRTRVLDGSGQSRIPLRVDARLLVDGLLVDRLWCGGPGASSMACAANAKDHTDPGLDDPELLVLA